MKSLKLTCYTIGCLLILSVLVQANNSTWGYVGPYDRLLARDFVQEGSSWLSVKTVNVNYPPKGHVSYSTLTAVRAWDWGGRKNFGYASLIKGGPGHRNATVHLKSQRGKALNFTIEYYGR